MGFVGTINKTNRIHVVVPVNEMRPNRFANSRLGQFFYAQI